MSVKFKKLERRKILREGQKQCIDDMEEKIEIKFGERMENVGRENGKWINRNKEVEINIETCYLVIFRCIY